jgi:CDP-paratose 2-epimerase
MAFYETPRVAAVYNLGGGRANSISVLEAIERLEERFGRSLECEYVDEARRGDHICYISDLARLRADYPDWDITISLDEILDQLAELAAPATT